MFTLEDIKAAHSKVKSGSDFPKYVHDLLALGVVEYTIYVSDGHAEYLGEDDYSLIAKGEYPTLFVALEINRDKFMCYLKAHQQGETNYLTFCKHAAETGVEKWTLDVLAKTCTYFDRSGNFVLVERIPIQ